MDGGAILGAVASVATIIRPDELAVARVITYITHISHINPAGLAAISNRNTLYSRNSEHSGYHEC